MDSSYGMYLSTLDKTKLAAERQSNVDKLTANISEISTSFNERLIQEKMKENDELRKGIKKIDELLEVIAQQEAAAKAARE